MKFIQYRFIIGFLALVNINFLSAQNFQVTMTTESGSLVVKARPTGGNITTGFANMEFYLRYPSSKTITWGSPTGNTTNFPGIVIQKNDPYTTITEVGYTIVRFFLPPGTFPTSTTYTNGVEYEVFRVNATGMGTANVEMMHRDIENPYVLTMVNESASSELTNAVKFYGAGASGGGAEQSLPLSVVLPLDLLDFSAKEDKTANKLTWQTANERNTSHFEIEKSVGKINKFAPIGEVKAANNATSTPQYYDFRDENTSSLDYYRLKLVDRNGQFSYSKTLAVARKEIKMGVNFYPNPVTSVLNIQLSHNGYTTATMAIVDAAGKVVASQKLNNKSDLVFSFNVQHFQTGIYTAIVTIDGNQFMHKVMIN